MDKFITIHSLFTLLLSYSSANVVLFRGIPVGSNEETLICSAPGDYIIWRSDNNAIAIINSQKNVGYSIATTYNSSTIEFNATLLSAVRDSSSTFVRISSIQLNRDVYGNSEIQCESNLGSASLSLSEEPVTTDGVTDVSWTTETVTDLPSQMAECNDLDILRTIRGENVQSSCKDSDIDSFVSQFLADVATYAPMSSSVMEALQNLQTISSTASSNNKLPQAISHSATINSLRRNYVSIFIFILFLLAQM